MAVSSSRQWSPSLFAGKVALVTGAGSPYGIGKSIVLALAAAGAEAIYASDLNVGNMGNLATSVEQINSACTFVAKQFDAFSEEETVQILKDIVRAQGRFDVFVGNAGFINPQTINTVETSHYDRAMDVMSRSVFYAIKYGSSAMAVTSSAKPVCSGAIVITNSVAGSGLSGSFSDMVYTASKHAASGLIRAGAVNLSASNIRVNGVAPGAVRSSLRENSEYAARGGKFHTQGNEEQTKAAFQTFIENHRAGADQQYYYNRIPEPEEIADVAVFLASDMASSINGTLIVADSGKSQGALGESYIGPMPSVEPLNLS